jgi:hypothetical protein
MGHAICGNAPAPLLCSFLSRELPGLPRRETEKPTLCLLVPLPLLPCGKQLSGHVLLEEAARAQSRILLFHRPLQYMPDAVHSVQSFCLDGTYLFRMEVLRFLDAGESGTGALRVPLLPLQPGTSPFRRMSNCV